MQVDETEPMLDAMIGVHADADRADSYTRMRRMLKHTQGMSRDDLQTLLLCAVKRLGSDRQERHDRRATVEPGHAYAACWRCCGVCNGPAKMI